MPLPEGARKKLQAAANLVCTRTQSRDECYSDIIELLLIPLFRDVAPEKLKEAHRRAQEINHSHARATRLVDAGAAYALATELSPGEWPGVAGMNEHAHSMATNAAPRVC